MATTTKLCIVFLALALLLQYVDACARWELDLQSGLVLSGYNDVRIPGNSGTLISLSEELTTDRAVFFRARAARSIGTKQSLSVLVAPLRLKASGSIDRPVLFGGEEFQANEPLKATYRFDSYRLSYRYDIYRSGRLAAGLGLTGKIRDASISLEGAQSKREKKNTGFVPLINFRAAWMLARGLGILVEGDALAAPQGRAEDVLCGVVCRPLDRVRLMLGYRILEGGADVDEVYSFALLHYFTIGLSLSL